VLVHVMWWWLSNALQQMDASSLQKSLACFSEEQIAAILNAATCPLNLHPMPAEEIAPKIMTLRMEEETKQYFYGIIAAATDEQVERKRKELKELQLKRKRLSGNKGATGEEDWSRQSPQVKQGKFEVKAEPTVNEQGFVSYADHEDYGPDFGREGALNGKWGKKML
jgi:hypothetical protein